ncbi:hypothetical protein [Flavobacterium sp.]|uniref:hypothetical protein n=1 Tax=Flavobacterium sp. TaxID=239 RepID=UPI00286CEA20|nr:hypothetical protein [Flavobacterium sp.]
MPHQLTIQATDLQKMIKQLQLVEEKQNLFTIEGLLPSQFLRYAVQPNNEKENPKKRVKTILLHLTGDYQTLGEQLSDKLDLKTHLLFTESQYTLLYLKLNALLKHYQPEKKISIEEIKDCQSVADCVILFEKKI